MGCTGSVVLQPGRYKLEAWGAQGGSHNSEYQGGYGGYTTGTIDLRTETTLYYVVGKSPTSQSGGFNGGGWGGVFRGNICTFTSFGGGGATHIGLKPGGLETFSGDYATKLLIVAGGGGGSVGTFTQCRCQFNAPGGSGGGFKGASGYSSERPDRVGSGGNQNQGGRNNYEDWYECGRFGHGSDCGYRPMFWSGGGGGGGFFGGGSGGDGGPGGGGSGYINTSLLTNAYMYGYNVPTSSSDDCRTFTTKNVSSDAVSTYAKKKDGYAKITLL